MAIATNVLFILLYFYYNSRCSRSFCFVWGKIVKKNIYIYTRGSIGGEPTLFQLKVSAPVQVSKDNRTAKETINALICMRRTALRQLLWHRLFAYICSRQAFISLCEAKCRPRVAVFLVRYWTQHLYRQTLRSSGSLWWFNQASHQEKCIFGIIVYKHHYNAPRFSVIWQYM